MPARVRAKAASKRFGLSAGSDALMARSNEHVEMSASIANGLVVNAPLSHEQLDAAFRHYEAVAILLQHSGPRFAEAREEAKRLGNVALSRLRAERERAEQQRRMQADDDGLREII
jgi:hypothetical protein